MCLDLCDSMCVTVLSIYLSICVCVYICGSYNKVESDFELLRDFNDYQEAKEDAIFALVHNIDRPAVEAQLQAYQRKHVDEIRTRLAARDERDRQLGALLGAQQRDSRERVLQAQARDVLERKVEREARRQDLQIRMGVSA